MIRVLTCCLIGTVDEKDAADDGNNGDCHNLLLVVHGLSYLTLHGVVHRDVKPGNILCSRSEDGGYFHMCCYL